MRIALQPPKLLLAALLGLVIATPGCAAFRRRRTGFPGLQAALLLFCTGLLPFAGAVPSPETANILQSFVVAVPSEFQLSSPAQVAQLRGFPLRAVTSIDEANAPLHEVTWYKLVIRVPQADAEELAWFYLRATHLREASAYLINESGVVRETAAGFRDSEGFRFGLSDLILNIPLTMGATADVFIRSIPVSPFPMTPGVLKLSEIHREVTITTGFIWLYFGGALFLVLFQSIWWFHLRDPASRDYVILSIGMIVGSLARYGIVDRATGHPFGFYLSEWLPHLMLLNTILALRLHLSFYNLTSTIPNGARALHGLLIGLLLLLGAGIFLPPSVFFKFALIGQMLGMLIAIPIEITAARRGLPGARIALVGWLGMYAILFVVNLSGIGLLPKPPQMQLLPLASIMWEMVLNTLGLSRKFELISKQRHEAEKQEIERYSLQRLVRLLCHDISNPLSVIFLSSSRLGATGGNPTPDNTSAHLQRIVKASTAIREIIDSVRMLERLQLTGGRVEVAPTDLATAIQETESLFQEKLQQKSLRLVKAIPPDLPLVLAENNILKSSVLANILSNAIKYSEAGATIELSAARNENSVTLSVRDHGVGIPLELMDEFNRRGMIRCRPGTFDEQGTGLGLQLIHGFTTAMGGHMRLLSGNDQKTAGGAGTIVEIILPTAPPVAALKT